MLTLSSHLSLAFDLVAAVAHVFGVMLLRLVTALELLLLLFVQLYNEWMLFIV